MGTVPGRWAGKERTKLKTMSREVTGQGVRGRDSPMGRVEERVQPQASARRARRGVATTGNPLSYWKSFASADVLFFNHKLVTLPSTLILNSFTQVVYCILSFVTTNCREPKRGRSQVDGSVVCPPGRTPRQPTHAEQAAQRPIAPLPLPRLRHQNTRYTCRILSVSGPFECCEHSSGWRSGAPRPASALEAAPLPGTMSPSPSRGLKG